MSDEEALGGAGEAHVVGVAERIKGLDHHLAMLTRWYRLVSNWRGLEQKKGSQ